MVGLELGLGDGTALRMTEGMLEGLTDGMALGWFVCVFLPRANKATTKRNDEQNHRNDPNNEQTTHNISDRTSEAPST